jgi:ABC-type multidrug transport system permease subunit
MKALDIAFKDLLRSSRNLSVWIFGLVVPLLMSGIFYFAFGGPGSEGGLNVAVTKVVVVDQDQPVAQAGSFSAGQILADFLKSDRLTSILAVTEMADATSARDAVDKQEAGVAVIIPAGLTAAMVNPGQRAAVELYQDPTLTLGPGIVNGLVSQFVDGLAGSKIAAEVAYAQLAGHGLATDPATAQAIALEYGRWTEALSQSQQGETNALIEVRRPAETESADLVSNVVSMIMAGMLVFYVFFTGAASAQNLLQEEEEGTLARLFSTPTPTSAILSGRMIATFGTLILQVVVLLVASALLFKVYWGQPVPIVLVAASMIVLSASFGLFVTSLLKDTRQSGIVYGGVLTMMGMVGMIGIFTAQVPGSTGGAFKVVSLLVPQGWAVRAWQMIQAGGGLGDVLVTLLVMLGLAAVFFTVGLLRFRKRFA